MTQTSTALHVQGLVAGYRGGGFALRGVDLAVAPGERVAVVGESGCGKTTLLRSILGLLPGGARQRGSVRIADSFDLVGAKENALRRIRGAAVGYVPQNPLTSFDPLRSVEHHLREAWSAHGRRIQRGDLVERLKAIGIEAPDSKIRQRPSEWSGGMLQRASVVAATALQPPLVLADEPTSALDRPLACQMLALLSASGCALVVVTHDLDLIEGAVDRVAVMYAGRIVEDRPAADVLRSPAHPYTKALIAALPRPGILPEDLPGDPPRHDVPDVGCLFAPRCSSVGTLCWSSRPELIRGGACHVVGGIA